MSYFCNDFQHINGTTSATIGVSTKIMFRRKAFALMIDNRSTSKLLYVSFDNGNNWKTIDVGGSLSLDISGKLDIDLKSEGASQGYEILAGYSNP
jgi:hypothetical protein